MPNQNTSRQLTKAKNNKNDEFYTQYNDIEKEMQSYLDHNPNIFKNKTILLPCDDPERSNFTKYFAQNFHHLQLKKLISTSIATQNAQGKIFTLTKDHNVHDFIDTTHFKWQYLQGDGDFRSDEIKVLRDEADIIITNPPFSLFREFLAWIIKADKNFAIIGNMNAITYKDVFPLIQSNQLWLGATINSGDREFQIPKNYPLTAAGIRIDDKGNQYVRVKGVRWFTNIEHGKRHQPLPLNTMANNLQSHKQINNKNAYQKYDNYNAIEVPKTAAIPSDYQGVMGVPISFLDKYNPEQFKILGMDFYVKDGRLDDMIADNWHGKLDRAYLHGKRLYSRILITHKKV